MPPQRFPEIFACLAMVVGIYGFLCLEVARRPDAGAAIVAVGFLGKLLGPAGLLVLILNGQWPRETVILILTNDVIWWLPFGLYLYDLGKAKRGSSNVARRCA